MAPKNDQDKDIGEITIVNVRQNLADSIERVFKYFHDFAENSQNIQVNMSDKSETIDFSSEWAVAVQNQISVLKAMLATVKKATDISSETLSEATHTGVSEETVYDLEVAEVGLNEIQKNILFALFNRYETLNDFGKFPISIHEGNGILSAAAPDPENENVSLTPEEDFQQKLLDIQTLSGNLMKNFLGAIGYVADEVETLEKAVIHRVEDHVRNQAIIETFGLPQIGNSKGLSELWKKEFILKATRLHSTISNLEAMETFVRDRLPKQTLN